MYKMILKRAGIVLTAFIVAFLLIEGIIRIAGHHDEFGVFYFNGTPLPSNQLPVRQLQDSLQGYVGNHTEARFIYDERLGWSYNPNHRSSDGTWVINAAGLRADRDYALQPSPDVLRIATFGDSFTAGDEVANDESWPYQLEQALRSRGIRAEVLNFGVSAFGMDQAYLRWQHSGRAYSPDIVLFGFQPVDISRNLNIFRPLERWNGVGVIGMPFSKPRFILENSELQLINSPALSPEALIAIYGDLDHYPLIDYEIHYDSSRPMNPFSDSKFLSLIFDQLENTDNASMNAAPPGSERALVAQAIVDAFAADVSASNAAFIVVHLPTRYLNGQIKRGFTVDYQSVYDDLIDNYPVIRGELALLEDDSYYMPGTHYSPIANQRMATLIAAEIAICLNNDDCQPERFVDNDAYLLN